METAAGRGDQGSERTRGGAATPESSRRFGTVAPRDSNRIKTLAAMFASLALFAATRAHAATHVPACTITGTNGPGSAKTSAPAGAATTASGRRRQRPDGGRPGNRHLV